jgi:hypothetical protein
LFFSFPPLLQSGIALLFKAHYLVPAAMDFSNLKYLPAAMAIMLALSALVIYNGRKPVAGQAVKGALPFN